MNYVLIKYRALTVDSQHMPLFMYAEPLPIIGETEDTVTVQYKNNDYYTFIFHKKNVDRRF